MQNIRDTIVGGGEFTMKQGSQVKVGSKVIALKSLTVFGRNPDPADPELIPSIEYVFSVQNDTKETESGKIQGFPPPAPLVIDGIRISVLKENLEENLIVVKIESEI